MKKPSQRFNPSSFTRVILPVLLVLLLLVLLATVIFVFLFAVGLI